MDDQDRQMQNYIYSQINMKSIIFTLCFANDFFSSIAYRSSGFWCKVLVETGCQSVCETKSNDGYLREWLVYIAECKTFLERTNPDLLSEIERRHYVFQNGSLASVCKLFHNNSTRKVCLRSASKNSI